MVLLGCTHRLILMPVIPSYVGPTMAVWGHHLAPKPDFPVSASTKTDTPRLSSFCGASIRQKSAPALESTETMSSEQDAWDANNWMRNVTDEVEL
jgi:hypothetical protein